MLQKLHDALFANDYIFFFLEQLRNITFFVNKMRIFCADLDKIYLDDVDFDEYDPETIVHIRLLTSLNKLKKRKAFTKNITKELMSVAWHRIRWWVLCWPVDEKKKEYNQLVHVRSKLLGVIRTFCDRKLCMKISCNWKIFTSFADFSCVTF